MIKALWLLGVVALTLAAVVLVLCAAGVGQTEGHGGQTTASSAVERLQPGDAGGLPREHRLSPLVQQAQAFAAYLNPRPAARPQSASGASAKGNAMAAATEGKSAAAGVSQVQPASMSSPKFELHGISYYRAKPEQSMALVCEPSGHRRWLRQGAQFGRLMVERIDGDSIVCRDGAQTLVMPLISREALAKAAQASGSEPDPKPTSTPIQTVPAPPPVRGLRQIPLARVAAKIGVPSSQIPLPEDGPMESQ